jgi:twitching motility protein PilU
MYSIEELLNVMVEVNASDLYISMGAYPMMNISGETVPLEKDIITSKILEKLKLEMLTSKQSEKFQIDRELDFTYSLPNVGRFRVNYFKQRNSDAFVVRQIIEKISSFHELGLPDLIGELALAKRGLVLIVGGTGSGKSTTLASLVDYRNSNLSGHILTLEDPIEFLHRHKKSVVNQREIGQDSSSYQAALKSALREAPSMLLIGEIRDQATMNAALSFAETGHLVLSTLHAKTASQTIERILSFFEPIQHEMVKLQLSQNINGIVAQRLVPGIGGGRQASMEILLSSARVKDLIHKGEIELLQRTIENSNSEGMISFDQSLFKLFKSELISEEDAVQYADHPTDLKLLIRTVAKNTYTMKIELDLIEQD